MSFTAIQNVLTILETIDKHVLNENIFKHVQTLIKSLPDAIDEIRKHRKNKDFKPFNNKTKLCASQLSKALPNLVSVLSAGIQPSFKEVTDFLIEKIRWCLLEVLRVFNGGASDSDREPSGMFVSSIDFAINSLQNDEPINDEFKNLIDDLLCQALTIAKHSSANDYQDIAAGCKNVLVKMSAFRASKERHVLKNLKKDLLLSSLETLERRVNTAVLRMYLHVMSEPYAPIKTLALKCLGKKTSPKYPKDLNQDILQLDHYCDQVQLIGNFAVACTENFQTKLKVQCSLASLEFCENYLVPTAVAFYLDPTNLSKRHFFKFLADECQKEIKSLQLILDNIVDTTAFVQVIYEDLSTMEQEIKDSILDGIFSKKESETFLFRCFKLVKHLYTTDDKLVREDRKIKEAANELEKASLALQYKLQVNVFNQLSMQNLVAEMELILFCINKISQTLSKSNLSLFSFSTTTKQVQISNTETPDRMELSTKRITNTPRNKKWANNKLVDDTSIDKKDISNLNSLEPYLIKVAETPRKLTLFCKTPSKITPCPSKIDKYSSYSVTDILDQLTSLSETFSNEDIEKPLNHIESVQTPDESDDDEDAKEVLQHILGSDGNVYDTINRMEDIEFLDNKLSNLKMNH